MAPVRTVCVYCGSGFGGDPAFTAAAVTLGKALAEAGIGLVYGGGNVGLMGTVARAVLENGGHVTGIIPDFLKSRERMLDEIQETIVVEDMHTRKRLMFERSDAFVALPGGIGTFEELFEIWTWRQLGYHDKPTGILNVAGYYDGMLGFLAHSVREGFMGDWQMSLVRTGTETDALLAALRADVPRHPRSDRLAENL
ncbi:MAG: TIGR00730 family Rossman fold protein [Methylobacterium sp.]|nr:MAG: TIGR00730 family Rossman fold protein [Methylobacterium sp.]